MLFLRHFKNCFNPVAYKFNIISNLQKLRSQRQHLYVLVMHTFTKNKPKYVNLMNLTVKNFNAD